MRMGWIQICLTPVLVIAGVCSVIIARTPSDANHVSISQKAEQSAPERLPVRVVTAESLIEEAIDGNSSDAAAQLVLAGSDDPKIVARLLDRLDVVQGRPAVIAILSRIGKRVTPQALEMLRDEKPEVRWSVLRLLMSFDDLPPSIAPQIARCLEDDDVWVRRWAAMLLAQVNNDACVADLIKACGDSDAEVRWRALRALHRGRSPADVPESLLREALADADPDVRFVATQCSQSTVVDGSP